MAGPISITERLDDFYTTMWYHRKKGVADQIFDKLVIMALLKEKGGMTAEPGGRRIEYSMRIGDSPNIEWIQRGDTVNLSDMSHLAVSYYDWRYLTDSIVRFYIDDINNTGKNEILKLAESKVDTSKETLKQTLEKAIFGTDASSAKVMHGLQDLVPDNPSGETRAIGGYNGASYDWWRNQAVDGSAITGETLPRQMRKMQNDCGNNQGEDMPNLIITGQKTYEAYENSFDAIQRVTDVKVANRGFTNLLFHGSPLVWSPKCSDARMYFLNLNYLKFVYNSQAYMTMTEWKPIVNQPGDRAAQIITACNMCTNRRRVHGVIHSLDDTLWNDPVGYTS